METGKYKMKIALVISSQHSISHGGVGQFAKTVSDLLQSYGHEVHFLFDKKPKSNFLFLTGDRHFFNNKPLPTVQGPDRHKQDIDYAKIENFKSVLSSWDFLDYDYYIVNTSEAIDAISQITTNSKIILYTHLFNQIFPEQAGKSVFTPEFVNHFNSFLYGNHTVATQSEFNKTKLLTSGVKDCVVLPMPMTEPSLLESSDDVEKSGVLYIGTHSPGKNPSAYISCMKKLQLPCKVMTSPKSAKTFEKKFKDAGITDYDIRVGITGSEKVDFIKGCKVYYHTSLYESYSYSFLECVGHMPVVVLDKQTWSDNFDSEHYYKVSSRNAHKTILELYNQNNDRTKSLAYVNQLNDNALNAWSKL